MLKRIAQLDHAPPWGLFGAINTAFVPLVAVIAGTLVALALIGEPLYIAMLLAWNIGAVITIAYVRASRRAPDEQAALRLGSLNTRLLISLLLGIGLGILVDILALAVTGAFLPAPELSEVYANADSANWLVWALAVLFMLVLQPVADELVFRGVFLPVARQVMGGWGGLIVTAMVYALFHYLAYPYPAGGVWYALISPLVIGLLLGVVRANTGSTTAAIAAHIGFSVFALLKLLVLL